MSTLRMTQAIERLVDEYGADKVKDALAAVCFARAKERTTFMTRAKGFLRIAVALHGIAPEGI